MCLSSLPGLNKDGSSCYYINYYLYTHFRQICCSNDKHKILTLSDYVGYQFEEVVEWESVVKLHSQTLHFLRFLNTLSISSKNRMQGLVMTEIETNTPASNGSRKQIANSSFTLSDFLTDQFTDWWTNEIQVTQLWTSSRNSCLSSSWRSVKENPCRWRHSKMLILLEMRHE